LDIYGSGQGTMADTHQCSNEHLGFIKVTNSSSKKTLLYGLT